MIRATDRQAIRLFFAPRQKLHPWCCSLLMLAACKAAGPSDVVVETPTSRPPHPFEQRTWSGGWDEFDDPYIVASTSVFLSIDSQQGEVLEGFIWHRWGYLFLDGEEIDPGDAWRISGIALDDMNFQIWRTWYGVTLELDFAIDHTYPSFADGTIRIETTGYEQRISLLEQDYIDRLAE